MASKNLQASDIVLQLLDEGGYDPSLEPVIPDFFGPVTPGSVALSSNVQVHIVADEASCAKLSVLAGKKVIGLDAEWRPNLTKFIKTRSALLQVSSDTDVLIVDLLALEGSVALNDQLGKIFLDSSILKLGLSLRGDLTRILNACSSRDAFTFAHRVNSYVDLGLLH